MTTGLVIAGKGVSGVIVCGPGLGILKAILSAPAAALAAVIASRSVHSAASQIPLPGSAVELTVKIWPAIANGAAGSGPPSTVRARAVSAARCSESRPVVGLACRFASSAGVSLFLSTSGDLFSDPALTLFTIELDTKQKSARVMMRIKL